MRLIVILFILNTGLGLGQQLNVQQVDSLTYQQFVNGNYAELKHTGQDAIQHDIDFFYLRMRLGIAYYVEKNYEKALIHFSKAQKMNPLDSVSMEYLYFTYQFSDRYDDAKILSLKFSESIKKRLAITDKSIDNISIGYGTMTTNNATKNKSTSIIGVSKIYAEAIYNDKMDFGNIELQHTVLGRVQLFYAANLFRTTALGVVQTTNENSTKNFSNKQYQYNIGAAIPFRESWKISFGGAYYKQAATFLTGSYNSSANKYTFISFQNKLNSYSASMAINKRISYFETTLSAAYSNLVLSKQTQYEVGIKYYPRGNSNIYLGSKIAQIFDKNTSKNIYSGTFGGKIANPIWYETSASYGNHANYITNLGTNTFNTYDPILFIAGFDLIFLYKQFSIIPTYRYSQREGYQTHYTSLTTTDKTTNKYTTNLFLITLKWNL